MQTERRKVLDMLAEGKISAADAERLLNQLTGPVEDVAAGKSGDRAGAASLKYLRVIVSSADGDKANVRVPLGLLRTGINLTTMLPALAGDKLKESGIDLSHLSSRSGEELIEELQDLQVDVDSGDGDRVRVFCE